MVCALLETPLQLALEQSSGASLAALLWEWAITFDDEVALIWSKSNNSWLKWVFFFARYFIIVVQFTSRSLEMAIRAENELNEKAMRVWYSSQVMVAALSVSALEIVLMARVYALYNKQQWLGILLISILILESIVAIVGLLLNLPGDEFILAMVVTHLPVSFAYFGITSVVVQCVILILTLTKYARSSLSAVPLVRLMMRDGTFAFIMSTIFGLTLVVYTLCNITYAVTGYAWLLSAVSCATCRLIINMQRVPMSHDSEDTSTRIVFTSIFTDQIAIEDFMSSTHQRPSSFVSRGSVRRQQTLSLLD